MTTSITHRLGTPEHRAWLLGCADRLDGEGEHELAADARREADEPAPAPAAARAAVPCDDCGEPLATSRIPDEWSLDWWSHRTATGRACR